MNALWRRWCLLIATCGLLACGAPPQENVRQDSGLDATFDKDVLVIEADDGSRHEFTVYMAVTREQQRRGLMFVRVLPADSGMLFVYDEDAPHSMWMKNTYIPLDMVFARRDGSISSVIHDTQPLSLESQSSIEAVAFVLELNAGTARRIGIGTNSRIIWQGAKK